MMQVRFEINTDTVAIAMTPKVSALIHARALQAMLQRASRDCSMP